MTITTGILLLLLGIAIGVIVLLLLKKDNVPDQQQIKDAFGNLSKEALDQNIETFMKIAESKFGDLMKSSDAQLDEKKKLIDSSLVEMKKQLEGLNKQTTELTSQMESSSKGISELSDTTTQLRQILSSSQARGQWGERMVEDILAFIGLAEGINYEKQSQEGSDRPDFKFNLPDGKHINMDVKFPLSHYEKFLASENETEQESEKKAFLKDVRNHVKEISGRSYIDPNAGTVDYVLMFIPNESIYSFLNQEDKELIDFSLGKKILLCSPVTLYAILSLIRQAVSNFHMEQKAGEMQKLVVTFREQWEKFADKMDRLGKTIGTVSTHYEELSGTRSRALEKPMDKITELQMGHSEDIKQIEDDDG
ncbi:MAG: DNA recombination protein RmuC [Candidatus Marinimicrobia bacterium]|nr:DNA recombination protein RmuC [Candidatus Neomarinimicrobiota bacterium]